MSTLALPGIEPALPTGARREADWYPTPDALWRPFEPVLEERLTGLSQLIEPACGDGRLMAHLLRMQARRAERLRRLEERPGAVPPAPRARAETLIGFDVRDAAIEASTAAGFDARKRDWLSAAAATLLPTGPLGIITNPPFILGLEFAQTSIERAGPGGLVALLLRLTWLEPTTARAQFLAEHPADVWIPPSRGKFANDRTDSATAAWFVWPPEDPDARGHCVRYLGRS